MEYEDVLGDTEVEMKNGEMGVKYVKDGEVGCTPVVRTRSEESERSRNLNKKLGDVEVGGWDPKSLYSKKN